MTKEFKNKVAVLTGAASGFGFACAQIALKKGMKVVLLDVQKDALVAAKKQLPEANVWSYVVDVANAEQMQEVGAQIRREVGVPNFLFNNAGVGSGGLIWENSLADWQWVLGVNVWGVVHGIHLFTPMMLEASRTEEGYWGHIVNTASMAGLLTPPNMGVYNVSKHAVVALTETLYHDLRLVTDLISASVLCPYFVPTGITSSHRNRPDDLPHQKPTLSQQVSQEMSNKAVSSGKVSANEVAQKVFDAIDQDLFYIFSHPQALSNVASRMQAIVQIQPPPDPFKDRPDVGVRLRQMLRQENK